jgi:predicted ribonuclease YlaK
MMFWHHKRETKATAEHDVVMSEEVEALKKKAHQSAEKASRDINKLNDLLRANGITLNISIATGGHKRGH